MILLPGLVCLLVAVQTANAATLHDGAATGPETAVRNQDWKEMIAAPAPGVSLNPETRRSPMHNRAGGREGKGASDLPGSATLSENEKFKC
jgi:hypothetical protein